MMRSRPGFTATVVLTLAVGIGATTAMFETIHAALLSRLDFDAPERLVMGRASFDGEVNPWVSGYDYYDYRDRSESFESIAAFLFAGRSSVLGATEPERVETAFATWDFFETLAVNPLAGRFFAPEEAVAGAASVVVMSHGYAQRRFGGASDAVGSTLVLDGAPHTVVGVLPEGFHFMQNVDVWRLTYYDGPGADARRWHNLLLIGRLEPGVTLDEAQAEVDVISRNLESQYPETNEGKALLLTGLHDALVENVRPSLLMLTGAVSLLLLLACANVAALLLARGQSRLREIAIRSAMGASRSRLVRQLMTESLVLAALGGAVGILLSLGFQALVLRLLPLGPIGMARPRLDASTLLIASVVSLATGLLFGVLPSLRGTVVNLSRQLGSGVRTGWNRGGSLLRSGLVVLQVAASVVLLIGAGLMLRSLSRQVHVELGFDPENLLTASVALPENAYPGPERKTAFFESLVEEVEALPGVVSVGVVNRLPIRDRSGNVYVYTEEEATQERQAADMSRSADLRYVLPGYIGTVGIPLLAGRDIASTDSASAPRGMLVSESLAKLFFQGSDPLGRRLFVDMGEKVPHEIVGVVGDARLNQLTSQPFHAMYLSYRQVAGTSMAGGTMRIAIKTESDPAALTGAVREVLRARDPNVPLAEPATMEAVLENAVADYRVITSSLGLFATIALMLALVALHGVLAYQVSERRHEIGVRMALGAAPRQIAKLILARGMGLVVVGLAAGSTLALWATRIVRQLLFGVEPNDGATYLAVASLCGLVALLASLLPAWSATRVDPVDTLRGES